MKLKSIDGTHLYQKALDFDTTIKIIGPENDNHTENIVVTDEIDANEYETFTLEEFRSLIINYRRKKKDFIIARSTTQDPENENEFYNFYYAASELNRVLFKIESQRRLLHRMKVKNPLNNIPIIGKVYYYVIPYLEIDNVIAKHFGMEDMEILDDESVYTKIVGNNNDMIRTRIDGMDYKNDSFFDRMYNNKNRENNLATDYIKKVREGKIIINDNNRLNDVLTYSAIFFATDDDFLMKSDVREYFRQNILDSKDEFLYELNRTQNDFMALLEDDDEYENEDINDWRRILSAHCTLAISMLIVCLLIGGGPIIVLIFFPLLFLIFCSFFFSLTYVVCCRRNTFETLEVESVSTNSV